MEIGSSLGNPRMMLEYYASPGVITNPGKQGSLFDGLPTQMEDLCQVVQGILIHSGKISLYGVKLPEEREKEEDIRTVEGMLARIRELDNSLLTEARPPAKRLVTQCRGFATMLCAMLRYQRVPARVRCGFAAYFGRESEYVEHWICEYWHTDRRRWVMVDAQIDDMEREASKIKFNHLAVPSDQFLTAGRAWQLCRTGQVNPDRFGIMDMHGLWIVQVKVIQDLLSLNKVELLPWDNCGDVINTGDPAALDRIAQLIVADHASFAEVRSIFLADIRLRMPSEWEP